MKRNALIGSLLGLGLMVSSAAALAIPMSIPESNNYRCESSCLEDTGHTDNMYEIKWLAKYGSMDGFDQYMTTVVGRGTDERGVEVPEPGPLALLGLGLLLLGLRQRFGR